MARTSTKRVDRSSSHIRISGLPRKHTKNDYFTFNVTILLHICSKYLENNLISAYYFTFVNSSVTLINNYITLMANSNVTTESGGRQNMFPTETRPYIDESV